MHHIFIVEDHPTISAALHLLVTAEHDMEVCGMVSSGEDAILALSDASADLVTVDLSLPGMNGIELIRRLHTTHPQMCTLIVSSYPVSVYKAHIKDLQVEGCIDKIDAPYTLVPTIRAILTPS